MPEDDEDALTRRGPARHGGQPAPTVRPPRRNASIPRVPAGDIRDARGLTPWHYYPPGKQLICGVCDCHPCADDCPEPFEPDRLEWKAARANLTIAQWAADPLHAAWIAAHAERPDVAAWLEGQRDVLAPQPADPPAAPVPAGSQPMQPAEIFAAPTAAALAQQEQEGTAVQRCREAGEAFMRELGIDSGEDPSLELPVMADSPACVRGGASAALAPAMQEAVP